jgi:uncharacterized protein
MDTKIFVNLPVKDLSRSIRFYIDLGFQLNPRFTDETAACINISRDINLMLLTEQRFKEFTPNLICDAKRNTEALLSLTCQSRDQVNQLVSMAKQAGGSTYSDPKDYGFLYGHGFQDPDGHIWELIFMEQSQLDVEIEQGAGI